MLILDRREGESIWLDGGVEIVVVAIKPRGRAAVKIGIRAPDAIRIHRLALTDRLERGSPTGDDSARS